VDHSGSVLCALLVFFVLQFTIAITSCNRPAPEEYIRLPVLDSTVQNRLEHDEWHTYFERVYGNRVYGSIDLNSFEWLYNYAPLHLLTQRPIGVPLPGVHSPPKRRGTLYYCTSDMICGQYRPHGYFLVADPRAPRKARKAQEVLHHSCEWEDDSPEVWFYKLVGTGVFLKQDIESSLSPTHREGRVVEILVKSATAKLDFTMQLNRRILKCSLFRAGWNASQSCNCDESTAYMTQCHHAPVSLQRRAILNTYLC
jgi:hypothetical protein